MNEFELLGVRADASAEEIKAAFRRRARELHPDRHVRSDGTVPAQSHESFVELGEAMRRALAVRSVLDATAFVAAREAPRRGGIPVQRRGSAIGRTPTREHDPMLLLLTLPQRCSATWPDDALEVWALTLVPAARSRLAQARGDAVAAGACTARQHTAATAHALLTRTLSGRRSRRLAPLDPHLGSAYDALERDLPATLVERLPQRVAHVGPRTVTTLVAAATGAAIGGAGLWVGTATGLLPG